MTAPIPPIQGKTTVHVSQQRAFEVFTAAFDTWWPRAYHIGASEIAEVVLEPRVDGRWYERGVDGSECDWGRVLLWEPPHRVLFTWQIDATWRFDPDPARASEIDVHFIADGPEQTTVHVEHSHFERLTGGQSVRDTFRQGGDWAALLDAYSGAAH